MNDSNSHPGRVSAVASPPARSMRTGTGNRLTSVSPLCQPVEPKVVTGALVVEPKAERPSGRRRLIFRCARLVLTGAVLAGVGSDARATFISATREQAYLHAEKNLLRRADGGRPRTGA